MKSFTAKLLVLTCLCTLSVSAQSLKTQLEDVYFNWRDSMIRKDVGKWKKNTAYHRKAGIYNRIVSAYQPYPQSIFAAPMKPPTTAGLRAVNVNSNGATAISTYFGKVDFGVGGTPTDNLMVLYFLKEEGNWKYDTADFINLSGIPEVRAQLVAGDYSYVKQADFMASGKVPQSPKLVEKLGYKAEVYVFCPGREVKVNFNNSRSEHKFQNDTAAEVIIGGIFEGKTSLSFTTKSLPGSSGKEPMDIRVFLMPRGTDKNVKPVNVFQYRITPEDIAAGKRPSAKLNSSLIVTGGHLKQIGVN